MAQIITKTFAVGAAEPLANWLKEQLTTLHTFVKTEATETLEKLYFSESFYISLNKSSGAVRIVGDNGFAYTAYSFQSTYKQTAQIIKSARGDIAVKITKNTVANQETMPDNGYLVFALLKCKHGNTGAQGYGVYVPDSTILNQSYNIKYFVGDDSPSTSSTAVNSIKDAQDATTTKALCCGYNEIVSLVFLLPIFAVSSGYMSTETYIMQITPRMYFGQTQIGGKNYHCIGLLAMLDEEENITE
mgnify:CR=1 FL=1